MRSVWVKKLVLAVYFGRSTEVGGYILRDRSPSIFRKVSCARFYFVILRPLPKSGGGSQRQAGGEFDSQLLI